MQGFFKRMAVVALLASSCAGVPDPAFDHFGRVRIGMTRDDTIKLLGAPLETMKFSRLGTESWDYRSQDTWGYLVMISVIFGPEGTVRGVVTQRLNDGGEHGT